MGTYTTNYNLFMPTVGEQGWGDLVNGNFTTIDTTMKSLSNRITVVENKLSGTTIITVTPSSNWLTVNTPSFSSSEIGICVLPFCLDVVYTGNLNVGGATYNNAGCGFARVVNEDGTIQNYNNLTSTTNITFTKARAFYVWSARVGYVSNICSVPILS